MIHSPRETVLQRLVASAKADLRVVGVVDYGSGCRGLADQWSDIDVVLAIKDESFSDFERQWRIWVSRLGDVLLAYISGMNGAPCVVVDGERFPVRVDLAFYRESELLERMPGWPNSPTSVAAMILYDNTGGRLAAVAARLVGQSTRPTDVAEAFARTGGDFWYFLLRAAAALERGQLWAARHNHQIVMDRLLGLLRIESDALDGWLTTTPAKGAEQALPVDRLQELERCAAIGDAVALRSSLACAAEIGQDASRAIAAHHGWSWPVVLAGWVLARLRRQTKIKS